MKSVSIANFESIIGMGLDFSETVTTSVDRCRELRQRLMAA